MNSHYQYRSLALNKTWSSNDNPMGMKIDTLVQPDGILGGSWLWLRIGLLHGDSVAS